MRASSMVSIFVLGLAICGGTQAAPFAFLPAQSGNIYKLDVATNQVVITLAGASGQAGVAVTPDGSRVYVTNQQSGSLLMVDTTTSTMTTIPNITNPFGIAIDAATGFAYAASSSGGKVYVLDTNPTDSGYNQWLGSGIAVGSTPFPVAVSADGTRVYVGNFNGSSVSVIDAHPGDANFNQVVATITVGISPSGLAVSPDGSKVYVTSMLAPSLQIIDTATNTAAAMISLPNNGFSLAFAPSGRCAYATTNPSSGAGSIAVIDVVSSSIVGAIPVGTNPTGISLTHDGRYAYVANNADGTVSRIDTATAKATTVMLDTNNANANVLGVGNFITPQNTDSIFANGFGICGF